MLDARLLEEDGAAESGGGHSGGPVDEEAPLLEFWLDVERALELPRDVAHGYHALLEPDEDEDLAIGAVLSGNVVDALFGCSPMSNADKLSRVERDRRQCAREVKAFLQARSKTLHVRAVEFYDQVFQTIVEYRTTVESWGPCGECCVAGSARRDAEAAFHRSFRETLRTSIYENPQP